MEPLLGDKTFDYAQKLLQIQDTIEKKPQGMLKQKLLSENYNIKLEQPIKSQDISVRRIKSRQKLMKTI